LAVAAVKANNQSNGNGQSSSSVAGPKLPE